MRISDWSSDVCSSDLKGERAAFTDGSVTVPFNLRETVKRSKHAPTPEALAKEEKERKRRDRRWARNDWDYVPSFSTFRHWLEWDYAQRSEERSVGNECVRTCRYRWQPDN